jgi:hypothetical protein
MKITLCAVLLLLSTFSFAQLTYKSCGRVYDAENKKLSKKEVRALLVNRPELLQSYNSGMTKKSIGGILIGGGIGAIVGSAAGAYVADVGFPTVGVALGVGMIAVGIPVRSGYTKKMNRAIDGYNGKVADNSPISFENLSICANQNGVGLRLNF